MLDEIELRWSNRDGLMTYSTMTGRRSVGIKRLTPPAYIAADEQ